MRSGEERPQLFGDPHGTDQQIDGPLEKRRIVAFDSVTQEQEHPPTDKAEQACLPAEKQEEDNSGENQRYADAVEQLVPPGTMFVVILIHVVR